MPAAIHPFTMAVAAVVAAAVAAVAALVAVAAAAAVAALVDLALGLVSAWHRVKAAFWALFRSAPLCRDRATAATLASTDSPLAGTRLGPCYSILVYLQKKSLTEFRHQMRSRHLPAYLSLNLLLNSIVSCSRVHVTDRRTDRRTDGHTLL